MRWTTRDLLWLTMVVAMGITLAIQHQKASAARRRVDAALNHPVDVDFVETPLAEAAMYISVKQGVPIFIADEANSVKWKPISVQVTNVPLQDALERMLQQLDLIYRVEDGWILIKPRNP